VFERRGARFLLEVLFLAALAAGLAFARLDRLEIVGVMLAGWVVVALLEWTAWRNLPHFGSGLPPRYLVPRLSLPPARPLEQVAIGYPEATRDEAPTWIATPALRSEVLGDWPVAGPVVAERRALPVQEPLPAPEDLPDPDSWTVVELPPAVAEAPAPAPRPGPGPDLPAAGRAAPSGAVRLARYSFDPLEEPARRKLGRRRPGGGPGLDVPAKPYGVPVLPRPLRRDDAG